MYNIYIYIYIGLGVLIHTPYITSTRLPHASLGVGGALATVAGAKSLELTEKYLRRLQTMCSTVGYMFYTFEVHIL